MACPQAPAGPALLASVGFVSALTTTHPAVPVTERARAGGGSRALWLAGLYYLVAAMIVTMWLWRDPASRIVAANPYDSDQFTWFFRYAATAVAHLRLPALITTGMNAPQGVNLMWNTPMLAPGVLLAPVTLLAGPQVSLTALMTAGFAGSALAMFAVLRRWDASVAAAAIGGLVYGFSPALIQSAQGHYDLQFAVLPPLIADAVLRLATGRCGTGRRAAARCGAWLGLLTAAQVLTAEELLFDSGVAALILLAVLAAARPRAVRARAGDLLAGGGAAAVVAAAIAGYPLWVQFFGPVRQHGSPFAADHYKNDLAGFVRPSSSMLLHTRGSAAFAQAFQGRLPEYLGYLGWPMLIVAAVAAALFWRLLAVRAVAVTFAVLEVLSLGGTLLAGGHEHEWVKLPWYWVQSLPVAGSAVPDRFSILADGAAAALLAFGLDAARARWPVERRGIARWVLGVVLAAAIVPLVPRPLPAGSGPGVPAGWTAALAALRLPAGRARARGPRPGGDVHRAAAVAGRDRRAVLDFRRVLHGTRPGRAGGDRRHWPAGQRPVPQPALGAVITRWCLGRRHPPGRPAAGYQRPGAGAAGRLAPGRRRRRHQRALGPWPLPDRAARVPPGQRGQRPRLAAGRRARGGVIAGDLLSRRRTPSNRAATRCRFRRRRRT